MGTNGHDFPDERLTDSEVGDMLLAMGMGVHVPGSDDGMSCAAEERDEGNDASSDSCLDVKEDDEEDGVAQDVEEEGEDGAGDVYVEAADPAPPSPHSAAPPEFMAFSFPDVPPEDVYVEEVLDEEDDREEQLLCCISLDEGADDHEEVPVLETCEGGLPSGSRPSQTSGLREAARDLGCVPVDSAGDDSTAVDDLSYALLDDLVRTEELHTVLRNLSSSELPEDSIDMAAFSTDLSTCDPRGTVVEDPHHGDPDLSLDDESDGDRADQLLACMELAEEFDAEDQVDDVVDEEEDEGDGDEVWTTDVDPLPHGGAAGPLSHDSVENTPLGSVHDAEADQVLNAKAVEVDLVSVPETRDTAPTSWSVHQSCWLGKELDKALLPETTVVGGAVSSLEAAVEQLNSSFPREDLHTVFCEADGAHYMLYRLGHKEKARAAATTINMVRETACVSDDAAVAAADAAVAAVQAKAPRRDADPAEAISDRARLDSRAFVCPMSQPPAPSLPEIGRPPPLPTPQGFPWYQQPVPCSAQFMERPCFPHIGNVWAPIPAPLPQPQFIGQADRQLHSVLVSRVYHIKLQLQHAIAELQRFQQQHGMQPQSGLVADIGQPTFPQPREFQGSANGWQDGPDPWGSLPVELGLPPPQAAELPAVAPRASGDDPLSKRSRSGVDLSAPPPAEPPPPLPVDKLADATDGPLAKRARTDADLAAPPPAEAPPPLPADKPVGAMLAGSSCSRCRKTVQRGGGVFCGRITEDGKFLGCGKGYCWRCMSRAPTEEV
eukprot:CAMPEP_0194519956 /NCGR_PEP_ID=MMETSP0253-20130528/53774_1 /TAXON_ID=2966 /ORGANISM="Noctiluca scintillans" /LENGTH=775 /DNA_ID=CAMNT_0039364145 /DNA_START=35 /DNA_END=2359 /DNA_ORIENTATION=-